MLKRFIFATLAFLLVFSNATLALGNGSSGSNQGIVGSLDVQEPEVKRLKSIKQETVDPNETIRVIIELNDEPAVEYATQEGVKYEELSQSKKKQLESNLLNKQATVKKSLEGTVPNVKFHTEFTTIFNGFSADVKQKDIQNITKISNVKAVYVSTEYSRPDVKPEMVYSKELVEAQKYWEASGFKGEGMTVGIIDTGIDPTHKDMVLSDASQAELTQEEVEAVISAEGLPGKFYTDKVPYGYNYMDKNSEVRDLGAGASFHGMHVAGTVAANGDEENGGIAGVAPEAQLLALKVFGNDPEMPSTFGDIYVKAIDDSIKLGVDVLNMSLGSTAGFVNPNNPEQQAVARAVENGVMMSISAGNSAYLGNGWTSPYPYASNPDYGVSGSPGVSFDSLQVASYENSTIVADALTYTIGETSKSSMYLSASDVHPTSLEQDTFELVAAGLGGPTDFDGKDFTGKFALIQRGTYDFVTKTKNAQAAGAAGVIIYNNTDGTVNMASESTITIPQVFMLKVDGDALKAALTNGETATVTFTGDSINIPSPTAGQMSDFTSWGLTPNLDFKPEITAPGGNILSTFNADTYGVMSGTSMAAPHVAGGSALIMQRVDEEFGLTGKDRVLMAKNILLNTGKPVVVADKMISPRRQGAGLMQLNAALSTPVIVTETTSGEAKVALKEVTENEVTFTLEATNYSDEDASYNVNGSVYTDEPVGVGGVYRSVPNLLGYGTIDLIEEGFATLTVDGEAVSTVSVPAGSSVSIDVTVAVSAEADEILSGIFTNGYWLEGFVNLVDPNDVNPELTVPYVGFKGEWDAAPVLDAPSWEGTKSFYKMASVLSGIDGEYFFKETNNETGKADPNVIAFSPNGDGIFDDSLVLFSTLRNAKELKINVLDSKGNHLRTLRTEYNVSKNYYDRGLGLPYNFNPARAWDGKVKGKVVADGQYQLEVKAVIDFEGAKWQSFKFPVKVDTVVPEGSASYDAETKTITASFSDDFSGISNWDVLVDGVSVLGVDENEEPVILSAGDTTYTLANLKAGQSLEVVVYDYAGNMTSTTLVEGVEKEDKEIPALHGLLPEYFGVESTNEVLVGGYVTDASGIAYVKVDGVEADIMDIEGETWFGAFLTLEDGYHEVTIEAADNKGNVTNIVRRFFVDTTAATVTLIGYESHVDTSVDSLELGVEVQDNFDEIRLFVDGEEVYFNELGEPYNVDRSFHQTIPVTLDLVDGVNTFEIKVVDLAGHETVEEVTIVKEVLNGFVQRGTDTFYYINGEMQIGWEKVGAIWYFFNTDGTMKTGWLTEGSKKYYLHEDGKMATSWTEIDGKKYYFHASSGHMMTKWVFVSGKWYFMNASTGVMKTGWLKDNKKWYYLNNSGDMATGWVKDADKWYFLKGNGEMQTGWLWTGGKWYFLNKSGAMATGWVHEGGKWYYMNHNGMMQTGWVSINGVWYHFNKSGAWVG